MKRVESGEIDRNQNIQGPSIKKVSLNSILKAAGSHSMDTEQENDTADLNFRKQKSYLMYISSRLLSL